MYQSLMKRYEGNPVLTIDDLPVKGLGYYILNPGAVKFNGEYLLFLPGLAAWRVMTVFCNA